MASSTYDECDNFNVTFCQGRSVAQVEINRPKALNAFREDTWNQLGSIFRGLSTDADVRVIVLTGAGDRAFTAGLDIKAASQSGVLAAGGHDVVDVARKATDIRRHVSVG